MRPVAVIFLSTLCLVATYLTFDSSARRLAMLPLVVITLDQREPFEPEDEGPATEWFDDYFTITRIDDQTIAIGEPFSHGQNFNYVILGNHRALLFDSGTGAHDIRPVVASLTNLPVTTVPSHIHYDHIGNHIFYASLAMIDLPYLRERAANGVLRPTHAEHLGFAENRPLPELHVTEWLTPGTTIDLGGRALEVLHTPGHTVDSMALFDPERDQLFAGDFITDGPAFLFVPGSSVGDELQTAESLLGRIGDNTAILSAHRFGPPGVPTLARSDVAAVRDTLSRVRRGELGAEGFWPRKYRVNNRVWLLTDFEWALQWETTSTR